MLNPCLWFPSQAFVVMPTVQHVQDIMRLTVSNSIMFRASRLLPHVIYYDVLNSPVSMNKPHCSFLQRFLFMSSVLSLMFLFQLMFYTYLMSLFLMRSKEDRGERIIYIKNISPSEARDLRETLRKIDSVTNYLPLLNKV